MDNFNYSFAKMGKYHLVKIGDKLLLQAFYNSFYEGGAGAVQ